MALDSGAPSGLLLVDKDSGFTSHDVVGVCRRVLRTRSIGHAGTLDPMATGLLVLGIGEGTKLLRFLDGDRKRYHAKLKLGIATDSGDADGRATESMPVPDLSQSQVDAAAARFRGSFSQRPPAVSAIKVGGEALYRKVRRGEVVTAPMRDVHVGTLRATLSRADEVELDVECSKGFYVRSLGVDLAAALGTAGHLSALRRIRSGAFAIEEATPLAQLLLAKGGDVQAADAVRSRIKPLSESLGMMPRLELDDAGRLDAVCGRPISRTHIVGEGDFACQVGPVALFDAAGKPIAVAAWEDDALRVVRGFVQEPK